VNVVAANSEERKIYSRIYLDKYSSRISVSPVSMFKTDPPQDFEIEQINYMKQPHRLQFCCDVTNHVITTEGDVYTCCGGSRPGKSKENFFFGNLMQEPYEEIIKRRNESLIYRFMHKYGVEGLAKVIRLSPIKDEFNKATFSHPCTMCMWALANEDFCKYFYPRLRKQMSK
jgi:hypothetical protein